MNGWTIAGIVAALLAFAILVFWVARASAQAKVRESGAPLATDSGPTGGA